MVKRSIIRIAEDKCTGCGHCIPNCPEGAIQMIDGKARLISDLFCDGLGACIGHCPEEAIEIEEREAEPYDERQVMENIIKAGPNTIAAHLKHLKEHGETGFFRQALEVLREKDIEIPSEAIAEASGGCPPGGCPGAEAKDFMQDEPGEKTGDTSSQLRQWPVQLHLVNPMASYFQEADVLLAADCAAFCLGDFHEKHLKGKALAIACPKLDSDIDRYIEKITLMVDEAKINTLTAMTMEVPCCGRLVMLAQKAVENAARKIPVKHVTVSIKGEILDEKWL